MANKWVKIAVHYATTFAVGRYCYLDFSMDGWSTLCSATEKRGIAMIKSFWRR